MKNPDPAYIKVTRKFPKVLEAFSSKLFEEIAKEQPKSQDELQNLVFQLFGNVLFASDLSTAILKYKELKLQFSKSGPVGDTSYTIGNDRQDYGKRKPDKEYKSTADRKKQTDRMKPTNIAWQTASESIKEQWNTAADEFPFFGVHLFKGCYLFLLGDNQPIPDPFLPTPEILAYYRAKKPNL